MADYISREAAIRTIDEIISSPYAKDSTELFSCGVQDALKLVRDILCGRVPESWKIPAADVRPVVLCRDCKHFNPYPGDCTDGGIEGVCKRHNSIGVLVMDEDFCSDAERI